MISTHGFSSERTEKWEESTKGPKKRNTQFSKNRLRETIHCDFCGHPAVYLAAKKNGKVIPCCKRCISFVGETAPWLMAIKQC